MSPSHQRRPRHFILSTLTLSPSKQTFLRNFTKFESSSFKSCQDTCLPKASDIDLSVIFSGYLSTLSSFSEIQA